MKALKKTIKKSIVQTLCIVCMSFFITTGCSMLDDIGENIITDGKKMVTTGGVELWVGGNCDCKGELYTYSGYDNGVVNPDKNFKQVLDDRLIRNELVVSFYPHVESSEISDFIEKTGLFKPLYEFYCNSPETLENFPTENRYNSFYVITKQPKTCTQLKEIISTLEESPIVAFASLAFWYGNNIAPVSYTPYFSISYIGTKNDLSDIYEVVEETNSTIVEIQKSNYSYTNTALIKAKKGSNGLEMSNYFIETGKIPYTVSPCIYGGARAVLAN